MSVFLNRITAILKSKRFFWVIMLFFAFEAIWIALSAAYPMAFDEDFHFGLIKTYSHYILPFLGGQPANANAYGAVAADPSYLYHYLMSFPFRFVELFTHSQTLQVIILRLIDVGFFCSGLILFRKVLLRVKISPALTNISILVFALIPITPQLAAHINYDNALFPLVAWVCLLTFSAIDQIKQRKPSVKTLLTLITVCLFASIVKYAFLPIFFGVVIFLSFTTYKAFKNKWRLLWTRLKESWGLQTWLVRIVLTVFSIVSIFMFSQRDVVNLVKYHAIVPNCSVVLNIQDCSAYSVWDRDYTIHNQLVQNGKKITYYNPIFYIGTWVYWMWYRLFFAVNGPLSSFTNYPPLPLPSAAAALIGLAGLVIVIKWRKKIFHNNPYIAFFLLASLIYVASLWIDGYSQYRYTGELVTMNGRYLLPILLLLAAILAKAFSIAFRNFSTHRKTVVAVVALVLFLQGGGFLTFITRSDASWYWPNSFVVHANNAARKITKPIIIKGSKAYSTKFWVFN